MPFDASLAPSVQRYKIGEEVGKGGQGRVYLCEDSTLGRTVALKEPKEVSGWSRLQREVLIASKLSHPNIVPVYDITTVDGIPCSVMKLVGSKTLENAIEEYHESLKNRELLTGLSNSAINKRQARTLADLLRILKDTCNAIAYAHSQKVLHRDLKPQNISLGEYGETIVLDWGLACSIDDIQGSQLSLQSGSVGYCAPEQLSGDRTKIGFPTDIYSLGAILFKILTNTTVLDAQQRSSQDSPRDTSTLSPKELQPTVPADLDAICRKALQWKPEDRYATVTDFAKDLDCFAQDLPVSVRKASWRDNLRRFSKVHYAGLLSTATAATIAAIASGVIISLVLFKDKQITAARDDMATALTVADNTLRGLEGQDASYWMLAEVLTGEDKDERVKPSIDAVLPLYEALRRMKQKNSSEALPLLITAIKNDPERRLIQFFLSIAQASVKDFKRSLETAKKLSQEDANSVYAQQNYAYLLLCSALQYDDRSQRLETLGEAESIAQRAYDLNDEYHLAVATLGEVKLELGKYDDAAVLLKKAVALNPTPESKRNLIYLYRAQEKFDAALEISEDLIQKDPGYVMNYFLHAKNLRSLGRLQEAVDAFRLYDERLRLMADKKRPTSAHWNEWGMTLVMQRKYAEAIEIFEKGSQQLGHIPTFQSNYAYALLGAGQVKEGMKKLDLAFQADQSSYMICQVLQGLLVSNEIEHAVDFDLSLPVSDTEKVTVYDVIRAALAHIACTLTNRSPTPAARQWAELSQSSAIERETWDYYYLEQWLEKLPDTQRAEATSIVEKLSSIIAPRYPAAK